MHCRRVRLVSRLSLVAIPGRDVSENMIVRRLCIDEVCVGNHNNHNGNGAMRERVHALTPEPTARAQTEFSPYYLPMKAPMKRARPSTL